MKTTLATGLLLAAFAASSGAAHAQNAYPLDCMGGGRMTGSYSSAGTLTVNFMPGTAGTRASALSAGQCSWRDRGLRSNEPNAVLVNADPAMALYVLSSMFNGAPFSLNVYNDQQGYLRVAR